MLNRIAGHRPAEVLVADLPRVRVGLADGVDHVAQQHRVADQPLDELAVDDLERVHIERVHIEQVHVEQVQSSRSGTRLIASTLIAMVHSRPALSLNVFMRLESVGWGL
jgi:hypothetical protein